MATSAEIPQTSQRRVAIFGPMPRLDDFASSKLPYGPCKADHCQARTQRRERSNEQEPAHELERLRFQECGGPEQPEPDRPVVGRRSRAFSRSEQVLRPRIPQEGRQKRRANHEDRSRRSGARDHQ